MTLGSLQDALGEQAVITDVDRMDRYCRDAADFAAAGRPCAVVRAGTVDDVVIAMQWASAHRVAVVPRGAGTGLSGGASAEDGCLVLSLERMNAIKAVLADDLQAVVEPGVVNADLDRAAAAEGLFYAPDPSSLATSTIGGNLATNAGGFRCLKYGVTRDAVLALQVVLADGQVIRTGARTVKNVVGYDLTGLFVGSEGTLGIITEATVRLRPRRATNPATFVATFPSVAAAGAAVATITRAGLAPSLLELMDAVSINIVEDLQPSGLDRTAAALLIGQADADDAAEQVAAMVAVCEGAGADLAFGTSDPTEAQLLLHARRLHYQAAEAKGRVLTEDVGVPRSRLPELLDGIQKVAMKFDLTIATVGHAGDGNMHPAIILPRGDLVASDAALAAADEICRLALQLDGTISGEHGIGSLKRSWLAGQFDEATYRAHRAVKAAFDPLGILNPGKAL